MQTIISSTVPTGLSTGDCRGILAIKEPVASFLHIEEFPTAGLGIASGLCQELAEEFGLPIEVPALAVLATVGVCF